MSFMTTMVHHQNDLWVLYHKVTFDGVNKKAIINEGETTINVDDDLYSDWKEWVALRDHLEFSAAFRTVGGDPTVSGQALGETFFTINGWQVVIADSINFDGNLFSDDFSSPFTTEGDTVLAQTTRSNLIDQIAPDTTNVGAAVWGYAASDAIASASTTIGWHILDHLHDLHYENKVWVDTNNGVPGVVHPIGVRQRPSNSISNAIQIANDYNIGEIQVVEDATIASGDDVSNFIISGSHASKSEITVTPGAITTRTQFQNCSLLGTLNGEVIVRDSRVEDLLDFEGILHQCLIDPGGIRLANGGAKPSHILDCYSGKPGTSTPELDFNSVNVELGIRNYTGGIKLVNKDGNKSVSIDMNSGHIILDGTVTSGTIVCRGVGKLTDTSSGASVLNEMHDSRYSYEAWQLAGLDSTNPLTVTPTSRTAGASVTQTITGDPETSITVTRS